MPIPTPPPPQKNPRYATVIDRMKQLFTACRVCYTYFVATFLTICLVLRPATLYITRMICRFKMGHHRMKTIIRKIMYLYILNKFCNKQKKS